MNMKKFTLMAIAALMAGSALAQDVSVGIERPRVGEGDSWIYDDFSYITTDDFNKGVEGATVKFYQTSELEATLAKATEEAPTESGYATGRVFLRGTEYNPDYVWKVQTTNYKSNAEGRGAENFTFGFDLTVAAGKQLAVSAIDMDLLVEQNPVWRIRILNSSNEELYNSNWAYSTGGYNQKVWGVGSYARITSTEPTFTWGDNDGCLQYYPVFDATVTDGVVTYKYEENKLIPADFVLPAGSYKVLCDIGYANENVKSFSFDHFGLEGTLSTATGIAAIQQVEKKNDGILYNLSGQRIAQPVRGQIYIMNGKKYIGK